MILYARLALFREQAKCAKQADARADIYSLGCTLFTLLTARPVYLAETVVNRLLARREEPIPSLHTIRAGVPEQLDSLFQQMIAKRPEDRPASMSAVIEMLHFVPLGITLLTDPIPVPPKTVAGELGGVAREADVDVPQVEFWVENSVRNDHAIGPRGEVMVKRLEWLAAANAALAIQLPEVLLH